MATYADLKARIIAETHRDDLQDELATILDIHVADAVAKYASNSFWFNQKIATVPTVASAATVAIPATFRTISRVTGEYGDLQAIRLDEIADYDSEGFPGKYAFYDDTLMLYPTPDAVYSLKVIGLADVAAPADDDDDSIWTNEAARLIAAETRFTLYRDVFSDDSGMAKAIVAVNSALNSLQAETMRRQETRLVMRPVSASGMPIVRKLGV